ncbi:MAG: tetratricopeptide repeat protein [Rhodospirillales bacterium]|jgi:predicted Zn-dependent protease/ADP-heptose:LPS heptosyltransferase
MIIHGLLKALDHHRAGRLREAERLYRKFLAAHPTHEDARRLLAVLKHQTGRSGEALADLDALLKTRPLFPEAQANRAVVLAALGRPDEAEAQFRHVLALAPGFPDAMGPLLRLLLTEERLNETDELLHAVPLAAWPLERAALAQRRGDQGQAEAALRAHLGQQPGDAAALAALVPVLTAQGRHAEAIEAGRAALALNPRLAGVRHNLALALLDAGRLAEGWAEFAHRWEAPGFPSHPRNLSAPRWNGIDDLTGKTVLVWREQGIGDEITFASALPDLIERAGRVIVECSAKLVSLFARSFPGTQVRTENRAGDPHYPGIDFHMPMGDLFAFLRPTLDSFPNRPAYLQSDPKKEAQWKARLSALGSGPKIGIAWKSTLATPSRAQNFLPALAQMGPVLSVPGRQFVNLQPRADKAEIAAAAKAHGATIHAFDDLDLFDDLESTAALMVNLDKVVAIGTATAILSAALGVPTGMFLHKHAQWDPMGTDGIPWLPQACLFRRLWNQTWDRAANDAAGWLGQTSGGISRPASTAPTVETSGAEALLDQATAMHLAGRKAEAESLYGAVLARDPDRVEALVNLAALLDESRRTGQAVPLLQHAYRLRPGEPAIPDNLAHMLIRQDRLEEAVLLLEAALRLEPGNQALMSDLGNALRLLNRLDESAAWLDKALALAPQETKARFNFAKTLREQGRCAEALAQLQAIPDPDDFTRWEIGAACLQMGDLKAGWKGIEFRPQGLRNHPLPDCRGKAVFVRAEQGVGDVLIYGSALPDLLKQAGRVYLAAPRKLHALLARSFPDLLPIDEQDQPPAHDLALPIGSLFHLFRPALDSFAQSQPFLKADPAKIGAWKRRLNDLGPGFKLGLAWRSSLVTRERARHFPGSPDRLRALLDLPGVVPVNLQAQARSDELRELTVFPELDLFDDLDEAAALISALDAVAANGSAIAMLAGALGTPTALLMRAHASWDRLGTDRLPWLPTANLFDCAWNQPWEAAAQRAAGWIKQLQSRSNV